jgi:signal transduction histidine kinase
MNPTSRFRILLVEDNPDDELLIARQLRKDGLQVVSQRVETLDAVRESITTGSWDLVIADYCLTGFNGLDTLAVVKELDPNLPFILVSGTVGEEVAVESIKAGADDYLLKQNLLRLSIAVNRAIRESEERRNRMAAERALIESRERLELIYHSVSDFLVFLTAAPEGRWLYTSANRSFIMKLVQVGLPRNFEEFLGRDAYQVETELFGLDLDTVQWFAERRREVEQTKRTVMAERLLHLPNGDFLGEFTLVPIFDGQGVLRNLLVDGRDVTQLRRAEDQERRVRDQMLQAQKMESLGTLSGGIAHDFNNLLTGIMGFAELAQESQSLATTHEHLNQIQQTATRARDLVRQILVFSRRQLTERETMYLGGLIREVSVLLNASLPKTITVTVSAPDPGPKVAAAATQLHQVILNLCTNSAYAMPTGGRLSLLVSEVILDEEFCRNHPTLTPGVHARLTISDTGTGIPPEVLPRVFEPFFTTKPLGEGTGLGLSVVHGIIGEHQGVITVRSSVGVGTTFEIYLPIVTNSRVIHPPAPTAENGNGERVLCLDDDPSLARVASHILAQLNYHPVEFTDVEAALLAFTDSPLSFDVVFTDKRMPKMSGDSFAVRIRKIRRDMPIIMVSGELDISSTLDIPELAGIGILAKPYTRQSLAAALHQALHTQS